MLFFIGGSAFAQERTVSGRVVTTDGTPLQGITVQVKGTHNAVATNSSGEFTLTTSNGSTIVLTGVGFQSQEIKVGGRSEFTIVLQSDTKTLEQVVVTALGITRTAKEIGYSTANISPTEITEGKSFNLGEALTNKVAGLTVYNTSAGVNSSPRIVLRGIRSMTGDNTALVVLDGVPVPSNTLTYLNPNDVQDISIMKGGQAATLYGSDGVNGAIIITTKKGSKRPEISFSNSYNVEKLAYLPKFQTENGSGSAYGADAQEDYHPAENQQYGPGFDGSIRFPGRVQQDGSFLTFPFSYIPGMHESFWNTGHTNQSDFSYRAGNDKSNIYTSFQRVQTNGIVPEDEYERNSFRFNASNTFDRLTISFDATYTWDKSNKTTTDYYFYTLNVPGWIPITDFRDWKNKPFGDPNSYFNDYYYNPFWMLDNNRSFGRNHYFNGNITAKFKITNELNITARVGTANTEFQATSSANPWTFSQWASSYAYMTGYNEDYDYFLTGLGYNKAKSVIPGGLGESYSNGNRINSDLFLTYNKKFNNFSLQTILGNNIQVRKSKNIGVSTGALAFPDFFNFVNSETGLYNGSNSISEQRKTGGYADATAGYKGFLFIHGTARHDWTSVFYKPGRKADLYQYTTWGADVSFSLLDAFHYNNNILNFAKIRASFNKNRNDNIGPYQLDQVYNFASGFPFSSTGLTGMSIGGTLPFSTLSAEKVTSTEVGTELGFLQNRVMLNVSYYRQIADQQILTAQVSPTTGIQNILTNAARVNNHGIEASLKTNLIRNRDWNLNVDFNWSYNTNKVTTLYVDGFSSLLYQSNGNLNLVAEKDQMFPYLKVTSFERDSATGKIIIDPSTGWPVKASGLMGVGNTMPKTTFGTNLNLSWKGFTLTGNIEYRGGYVIYNDLGEDMMFSGTTAISTIMHRQQFVWPNSVYLDASSNKYVENTNFATSQYAATYNGFGDLSNGSSLVNTGESFYSSGDFWKLRSLSLSYNFDMAKYGNIGNVIKGITITAWGRNLKTWLPSDNWFTDPEFSNTNGNSIGINTTSNTPPTRQWGGTLRVTF